VSRNAGGADTQEARHVRGSNPPFAHRNADQLTARRTDRSGTPGTAQTPHCDPAPGRDSFGQPRQILCPPILHLPFRRAPPRRLGHGARKAIVTQDLTPQPQARLPFGLFGIRLDCDPAKVGAPSFPVPVGDEPAVRRATAELLEDLSRA
jgi:hypothetical protein